MKKPVTLWQRVVEGIVDDLESSWSSIWRGRPAKFAGISYPFLTFGLVIGVFCAFALIGKLLPYLCGAALLAGFGYMTYDPDRKEWLRTAVRVITTLAVLWGLWLFVATGGFQDMGK